VFSFITAAFNSSSVKATCPEVAVEVEEELLLVKR